VLKLLLTPKQKQPTKRPLRNLQQGPRRQNYTRES
jgi:hypothetical protein